ncbi:P2X purinoceptor 7-like [Mercenaria mercenaria]|uniref:P2X purinoceptor 7-like n=1 Tax=Mercenaria mercenaria TaxID=6596 RepID=UPI00234EE159|nr:P2X purinoceptor 7-like [Mercenaria mercenaria]
MDEDSHEFGLEDVFGVHPYMYEPEPATENDEIVSSEEDSEPEEDFDLEAGENERLENLDWCECRNCSAMQTGIECKCCHEFPDLAEKLDGFTCITQHPGFVGNCLNRDVVEVSFFEFLQRNGPIGDEEPVHETYRYVAYRRLARWIWHRLTKHYRRVLPSCAVTAIRANFPSEEYTGYRYARNL